MNETSTTVNELGEKWNIMLQYKEGRVNMFDLEAALSSVLPICRQSGLPSVCIDSLIEILFKLSEEQDKSDLALAVVYNLIPNEPLSQYQTERLLHWLKATYYFNEQATRALIYWFIVSLKLGLVDKELMTRNNYYSFFNLFLQNPCDNGLNYLLKDITETHHVTNSSIFKLQECYVNESNAIVKKQISVLLKHQILLCQSITDGVKKFKIITPGKLRSKDKELENSLDCLVALHSVDPSNLSSSKIYEDISSLNDSVSSVGSIGINPEYDANSGQIRVTSLTRFRDLMKNYDNLEAPSNLLSILGGKCSSLYVALSSPEWQLNLEEQVAAVLTSILNNKPHSNIDTSSLFKSLIDVQTVCCQGIPSVTNFLKYYFVSWDGVKFRSEIFQLIPWAHFSSYNDFKEFMYNLFEVFIVSDLDFRIKLLDAFGHLYKNMMSTAAVRVSNQMHIPFISKPPEWMTDNAMNMSESFILTFETFINAALIPQKSGTGFLLQTLILYHQIFFIEKKFDVKMFTVLPLTVFLMCQTSPSIAVLNLLSLLISRYWKNQDIMAGSDESTIMYREKLSRIRKYALDIVKLLKQGLGGEKIEGTLMGQLMGENECFEFKNSFGQMKDIMSIMKNFSTLPVIYELAQKMKIDLKTVPSENYAAVLEMFAPHAASLIQESYVDPEDDANFLHSQCSGMRSHSFASVRRDHGSLIRRN